MSIEKKNNLMILGTYKEVVYKSIFDVTVVCSLTLFACFGIAYIIGVLFKEKEEYETE